MGDHQRLLSYTKLLAAHVNNARHDRALTLFHRMYANPSLTLDPFVFPLALKSCSALHCSQLGTSIHAHITKTPSLLANPFVACALVDMYGKCVSIPYARKLFDEIPQRTIVVWNAMISLYSSSNSVSSAVQLFELMDVQPNASTFNTIIGALSGREQGSCKALVFFRRMQRCSVKPNLITVLALLPVCVGVAALNTVKEIHGYSFRNRFESHPHLSSGLIEVYGRCGCVSDARNIFQRMQDRDLVAWSSMVSAYAFHGEAESALSVFREMELAKVRPDGIAFLGVLKACSHVGLADEALKYFERMQMDYGVVATSDHYACLVDVLSRAGRLKEAYDIVREMPVKVTAKAWGALLGACRSHGEVELAEIAARVLFKIEPQNAGNYVILASVYSSAGRFDEAERLRKEMKERGLKALPGTSWVTDND